VLRILSALVLLPVLLGAIWWSFWTTFALGMVFAALAFVEYADLTAKIGARVPRTLAGVATIGAAAAMAWPGMPGGILIDVALLSALVVISATAVSASVQSRPAVVEAAMSIFPALYLGLPIGAIVALRDVPGTEALLLLVAVVILSDTGQYYTGRLFGRRPLAPSISPGKTVEGAIGGLVAGAAAAMLIGRWWLPAVAPLPRALLGATVAAAGIAGDLFESQLKRNAGVKDSSSLIPGHGGILDRIDSWLFAGPIYYVLVRYVLL
jgi:phosphatidate cytidylyltransferase